MKRVDVYAGLERKPIDLEEFQKIILQASRITPHDLKTLNTKGLLVFSEVVGLHRAADRMHSKDRFYRVNIRIKKLGAKL